MQVSFRYGLAVDPENLKTLSTLLATSFFLKFEPFLGILLLYTNSPPHYLVELFVLHLYQRILKRPVLSSGIRDIFKRVVCLNSLQALFSFYANFT